MKPRVIGLVRHFDTDRGYGWIDYGAERDLFFHAVELNGQGPPVAGDRVEFVIGDRRGRVCAQHVRVLGMNEASA